MPDRPRKPESNPGKTSNKTNTKSGKDGKKSGNVAGNAAKPNGAAGCVVLPSKEQNLYKRTVKCQEQKQYKQGLKLAKLILSNPKCCDHSDTLAIKALLLLGLGNVTEAEETVRRGLKTDLRSYGCWNALAIIQKELKKYSEAIKCLRNCLKLDPESQDVLRNLSVLYIHTRELEGYRETRFSILKLKPTQRASWGGLALSYHLLGDHEMAAKVLEEYQTSQRNVNREMVGEIMKSMFNKKTQYDFEHSEILKYHCKVLKEAGRIDEALNILQENGKLILDKDFLLEEEVELLLQLGRSMDAVEVLDKLMQRNPNRIHIYRKLVEQKGLDEETALLYCKEKQEQYPGNDIPVLLSLEYCSSQSFREQFMDYIRQKLKKSIPSPFKNFNCIKISAQKEELIEQVLEELETSLSLPRTESSTLVLFYKAQRLHSREQYCKALETIETCLEHSPAVQEPDMHLLKAKILKRIGTADEAADVVQQAFNLDPTDRCLGNKLAKYQLRAGRIQQAVQTMANFTKPGEDVVGYLEETQCTWFLLNLARAYWKDGRFGECLVNCYKISDIFKDIEEDQLDLHHYSLTKLRLSTYIDLLSQQNSLRRHNHFVEMAFLAVQTYLKLYDISTENKENIQTSDASLKKERKKEDKENNRNLKEPKYEAEKLVKSADLLGDCCPFLEHLQHVASDKLRTHELAAELYLRKGKPLLVAKALKKMMKCTGDNSSITTHQFSNRLLRYMKEKCLDERVKNILINILEDIPTEMNKKPVE